jgi:glutathione S-transferase
MQLYGSLRSPFTRKAIVAMHELGLVDRIDFVPVVVSSTKTDPALARLNPLGQIPTLVTDEGQVIHDSLVVMEYLDDLVGGGRIVPADKAARWRALTRHSVGQGMIETLVKLFTERKRTDERQAVAVAAFTTKFRRTLPALEAEYAAGDWPFDIGDIASACALTYADFRFAELEWRTGHPVLTRRFEALFQRPSMQAVAMSGEGTKD